MGWTTDHIDPAQCSMPSWIDGLLWATPAQPLSPRTIPLVIVALLALPALSWLVVGFVRLRGTTLRAPCSWSLLSLLAIVAAEALVERLKLGPAAGTVRYLAATTTLCPLIGLLGAKRPQDRGWQFIVMTLWVVLALPALQSLVFSPASPWQLHPAWQGFLTVLVLTGLINLLPTRFGCSALLAAASQFALLQGAWPFFPQSSGRLTVAIASGLISLGLFLVGLGWPASRPAPHRWDRIWLDFRDSFGVVWGLRVAERVNQSARQSGSSLRLGWYGFHGEGTPPTADEREVIELGLRTQLRRFVCPDWIAARHGGNA